MIQLIRYILDMPDINTHHVINLLFRIYLQLHNKGTSLTANLGAYPINFIARDCSYLGSVAAEQQVGRRQDDFLPIWFLSFSDFINILLHLNPSL